MRQSNSVPNCVKQRARSAGFLNRLFTMKSDAEAPRDCRLLTDSTDASALACNPTMEGMILTVADMNRLEQAARISMSGFQDPDASASPAPHAWHPLLRFAAVALVAAIVLIVASQLG